MYIRVFIDWNLARMAIAHSINNGEKITSKSKFIDAIKTYLNIFGESCMDDHEGEYKHHFENANRVMLKYWIRP